MATIETSPAKKRSRQSDIVTVVVGVIALAGFAIFTGYLLGNLSLNETQWARALYLFSGVEALAFAAAGFFFGNEIQRRRVDTAEQRAAEAEERVEQVQQQVDQAKEQVIAESIKGRNFATFVETRLKAASKDGDVVPESRSAGENGRSADNGFADLIEVAQRLYPNRD